MAQQNSMRPQIPAGIAQSPQFAAARSITQEGLPAAFKQLLEDEITFKAMELLDGSANEQAIGELPSPDSVRTQTREGLMSMLGSIGPGIQQQGSQMARAQQQGPQMAMAQQSGGLQSQPTPNMAQQFASGGIIGFAKGGIPQGNKPKRKSYRPQSAIPVGNSSQPIPMLMQKYGTETVTQFIAEQRALDAKARALAEAGSAAGSMQIEDHKLMKEIFSEKYRDILNESMGMAGGGIVGFQDGGRIKRFQGLEGSEVKESGGLHPFSFVNWAAGKGIDLAVLGAQEVAALAEEFSNTEVGQNQRNVLGEVASGAAGVMMDAVPDTAMSQEQIGAREAQLESGRGGIGSALSNLGGIFNSDEAAAARQELQQVMQGTGSRGQEEGIASGMSDTAADLFATERSRREGSGGVASGMGEQPAENKGGIMNALRNTFSGRSQEEIDYRERANQSIDQGEFINEFAESDKFGAGLVRRIAENPGTAISTLMMAIPVGGWAGAIGIKAVSKLLPYIVKHPGLASFLTGSAAKLPWEKVDIEGALSELGLGEDYEAVKETLYSGAFGEDPMRPPTDTATSIIETGPTREEIAANVGRKPEGGFSLGNITEDTVVETPTRTTETVVEAPAENGMPAIGSFDSEVTTTGAGTADSAGLGTFLADSVAGNISTASAGYQAKLDAAIARQDDPLQAISTFLRAMGEGDTIGEGMQLAGKALDSLRRSNDAEQIALLQLLETGRISEQDFQLKRLQIQNEKDQIEAFEDRSQLTYQASIASTLARTQSALMEQFNKTFGEIRDVDAMTAQFASQAENFVLAGMDNKTPSKRQLKKLRDQPEFIAAVTTKTGQLINAATKAQMANSQSTAAGMMGL